MTTLMSKIKAEVDAAGHIKANTFAAHHAVLRTAVAAALQKLKSIGYVHAVKVTQHDVTYYRDAAVAAALQKPVTPIRELIRQRIKAVGYTKAADIAEIHGLRNTHVSNQCTNMAIKGEIWVARRGHKDVLYYGTQAAAEKAQRTFDQARLAASVRVKPSRHVAAYAPDAPTIYPPGFQITRCPGFAPRLQGVELPFAMGCQRGRA